MIGVVVALMVSVVVMGAMWEASLPPPGEAPTAPAVPSRCGLVSRGRTPAPRGTAGAWPGLDSGVMWRVFAWSVHLALWGMFLFLILITAAPPAP
jgi:hypothetical protein